MEADPCLGMACSGVSSSKVVLAFSAFSAPEGLMHILINVIIRKNSPLMLFQSTGNNFTSVCLSAGSLDFSASPKPGGRTNIPCKMTKEFGLNYNIVIAKLVGLDFGWGETWTYNDK